MRYVDNSAGVLDAGRHHFYCSAVNKVRLFPSAVRLCANKSLPVPATWLTRSPAVFRKSSRYFIKPAAGAGTLAASSGRAQHGGTATAQESASRRSAVPGGDGGDPEEDPSTDTSGSFQIGVDPFSQQLLLSALTGGIAWAIAAWAHLDLSTAFRLNGNDLAVAMQLSLPVLLLLLTVITPRWAPPYKGSELERLRHNYYMTAQVLQLYLDLGNEEESEDDDSDREGPGAGAGSGRNGGGGSSSGRDDRQGSGAGGERARVRRRLRLEQTVGWGTISSGLALMQACTLQPWNPPTANTVFGLGLAGRTAQQLANEFLVRGAVWGLLSGWMARELSSADASDGILFFGRVFGGSDTVKYVAGLALVALSLPGALWEARAARNFVRASVVGPVRDAAIFCTGNGVDEPAYCDPRGFAMMAARRPANAAPVADVVTRTRGWRSGPEASFSSVSSLGSMDLADLGEQGGDGEGDAGGRSGVATSPASGNASTAMSSKEAAPTGDRDGPTEAATDSAPPEAAASTRLVPGDDSPTSSSSSTTTPSQMSAAGRRADATSSATAGSGAPKAAAFPSPSSTPPLLPTLAASSAAFEWDSQDMSVLLRVETLQDKIAFWSSLYFQLLAAFALNGAFLASDCNLAASFAAAWLLRTGPLLLAEIRARMAASGAA